MTSVTSLTNDRLLIELKESCAHERQALARVLDHLREVETRGLHLARGYSSMFAFCVEYLGYSEPEAHVRIQAMRLSTEIPQVAKQLEAGELSLTVAAMAQSEFRRENKRRKETGTQPMRREEKTQVLLHLESASKREAQKVFAQHFPHAAQTIKMSFEATPELATKIENLRGLVAHKNFDGDLSRLIEIAVDMALMQIEKSKPTSIHNTKLDADMMLQRDLLKGNIQMTRLYLVRTK